MHTADELLQQASQRVTSRVLLNRLADMLGHACRQDQLLPGCTMPLPERGRWLAMPKCWPLRAARIELADGRVRRLGFDRQRNRWFVR